MPAAPEAPPEARPPVFAGWRPPLALAVALALAAAAAWRWPWARWGLGALVALALLRALGLAMGARAAGRDPEAGGARGRKESVPPAPPSGPARPVGPGA